MKPASVIAVEVAVQVGLLSAATGGLALADVSVGEGTVYGGVVGIVIVIGGQLVNLYLRVRKENETNRAARVEVDQAAEDKQAVRDRKTRKDAMEEWQQTVADLRQDRELDRQEIHELRNDAQASKVEHALAKERLDACEKDRAELLKRIEALEQKGKP